MRTTFIILDWRDDDEGGGWRKSVPLMGTASSGLGLYLCALMTRLVELGDLQQSTDWDDALFYIGIVPLTYAITWYGALYDARDTPSSSVFESVICTAPHQCTLL